WLRQCPPLPDALASHSRSDASGPANPLSSAIETCIEQQAAIYGNLHATLLAKLRTEFQRLRPTHVVVDQDATPLNRAVVRAAREIGARSIVVQHGVPYISFGFAPLEADAICAWGESSRAQLERWETAPDQIHTTGFPPHDALAMRMARIRSK